MSQGRKLSRTRDQRRALMKGLATALIEQDNITTTKPKAKELVPFVEKLITKAKHNNLHSRRHVAKALTTPEAIKKLCDELAPNWKNRVSGHLRVKTAGWRAGDGASMSNVSLIIEKTAAKSAQPKKTAVKKTSTKPLKGNKS